jgi:hypothetical protein
MQSKSFVNNKIDATSTSVIDLESFFVLEVVKNRYSIKPRTEKNTEKG